MDSDDETYQSHPSNYKRKPVNVQAWQIHRRNIGEIVQWCAGSDIDTFSFGDYILKAEDGEFIYVERLKFDQLFMIDLDQKIAEEAQRGMDSGRMNVTEV